MKNYFSKLSLVPKGLKYKTMISFSLMAVIPLLICVWLATTYIFPNVNLLGLSLGNISLILAISLFISLLGLYITKEMIDPVIKIAGDAKDIAEGNMDRVIDLKREDEIGDLSTSLNIMTQKIKENIEKLKSYSDETKLINMEINKKVLALSILLQIGNLISSCSELSTVLDFITQKLSDIEMGRESFSFMMLEDETAPGEFKVVASCNNAKYRLQDFSLKRDEVIPSMYVVDKTNPPSTEAPKKILKEMGLKNVIIFPIIVSRKQYGLLVVGNKEQDYEFKEDERELLKVFVKQASIAVENDLLMRKAKELAVKDELTGLYNENYIHTRLEEEIKRACMYQRPCGYLLIDIDNFKDFGEQFGEKKTEDILKVVATLIKEAVREVDKVARLRDDRFAVILIEKNKRQAATLAEEIRKKIEDVLGSTVKPNVKLTVSISVSENPLDGASADELVDKAEKLMKSAKSLGKNRVAV